MVYHSDARRTGGTLRGGLIAVALLALSLLSAVFFTHTAHASVLPSVDVSLPTGKLLAPVTDTVNKVTDNLGVPVSVNSTPSTMVADVSLPLPTSLGQSSPVQTSVAVPLPGIVPTATSAVSQVVSPATQAAQPAIQAVASATRPTLSDAQTRQSSNTLPAGAARSSTSAASVTDQPGASSKVSTASTTKTDAYAASGQADRSDIPGKAISPLLSGVASFFGTIIPTPADSLVRSLTAPNQSSMPYIISGIVFLLMLGLIMGIIYMNHTRPLTSGDGRVAHMAKSHDLVQLSVLSVAIIGSAIIGICLIFARIGM